MKRKQFVALTGITSLGILSGQSLLAGYHMNTSVKMPVLFLGHGSPMNAVQDNAYTRGWAELAKGIPRPKAILVISAHWETSGGTKVYAGVKPKMIYDMYGFPQNLYQVDYPCPGSPELAEEIASKVDFDNVAPTHDWGLDHGAWSVLVKMFPDADIPCFQMSLNRTRDMQWHYEMGKQLAFLRKKGVLILSSGNIVHNLRYAMYFSGTAPDWAIEFDEKTKEAMESRDHLAIIKYERFGKAGSIAVNSAEHYIPLLYALALQEEDDMISFSNHNIADTLEGRMMRCVRIG